MTALTLNASAAWGLLRRDLAIFLSYRFTFVSQLLTALFSLTIFYYVSRLVRVDQFAQPDEYFAFAVVGILSLEIVSAALVSLPMTLRQELVAGTFERLVLSPFGPVRSTCSMVLFPILWGTLKAGIMICVADLCFGLPVVGLEALIAAPIAVLAALSFVPFGLLIAALVLVVKQALGAGAWVVAGISLVAGFYFPIELLPTWLQWMSEVQPFTSAVELLRHAVFDAPLSEPATTEVMKLILFTCLLLPPSVLVLSRAVELSRRRGTIIEY